VISKSYISLGSNLKVRILCSLTVNDALIHVVSFRSNHLTRKSYYEEMFETIDGWDKVKFMETIMNPLGEQNCSHWGTYLYGKRGEGRPTIVHLDGRRRSANHHSEKSS